MITLDFIKVVEDVGPCKVAVGVVVGASIARPLVILSGAEYNRGAL